MCKLNLYIDSTHIDPLNFGNPGDLLYGWYMSPLYGANGLDGACFKTSDQWEGLDTGIIGFLVTGYCECEFFGDTECQNSLFSAFNRQDLSLKNNGPHDRLTRSVRCKSTDHIDQFVSGSIYLSGGTTEIPNPGKGDITWGIEFQTKITRDQLYVDCIPLPKTFVIKYLSINGVTCEFFKEKHCQDRRFRAGHGGKYENKYGNLKRTVTSSGLNYVNSIKCYPPYGIMWKPRDDL
ncbi:hypothetical protein TWF481_007471 [Arthrobotrys musiformis]|uniref:Homing endonuclease LAGLIDADG domain-containing protein n=1 Tax=Arthrobotrys musiformis TaxID=47236 RepID=A0AAV9WD64_9PEZI